MLTSRFHIHLLTTWWHPHNSTIVESVFLISGLFGLKHFVYIRSKRWNNSEVKSVYVLPESKHNIRTKELRKSRRKIIEIVRRPRQFSCQSVGWSRSKERKLSRSVFYCCQIICWEWILTVGVIFQWCYTYSPLQSLLSVRAPCQCEYLSFTEIWVGRC